MQTILLETSDNKSVPQLTNRIPAPILPIANRPTIAWVLDLLGRYACRDVAIHTYLMRGHIESYVRGGNRWGISTSYKHQESKLGTAGSVKLANGWMKETTLVMPASSLLDVDLPSVINLHRQNNNNITLIGASMRHHQDQPILPLLMDEMGQLQGVGAGKSGVSFTGACLIEPAILEFIPEGRVYGLYDDLLPALLEAEVKVGVYQEKGYWNPLLCLSDYLEAQDVVCHSGYDDPNYQGQKIRHPYIRGKQVSAGIYVGQNHVIHPSVKIKPPVCIGVNCRIGRNVELGTQRSYWQ